MTSPTPKKDQIIKWLAYYGIHEHVEIEQEAEETLLNMLTQPGVERVILEKDGSIQIEFDDTGLDYE